MHRILGQEEEDNRGKFLLKRINGVIRAEELNSSVPERKRSKLQEAK